MRTLGFVLSLAILAGARAPVQAQEPAFGITPQVGYMFFGDHLEGPLGTSLRNAAGPLYGAQLSIRLADPVALIGSAGYASSNLQVGLPVLGGIDLASTSVWLADAGIELRLPLPGSVRPFIQAGAGVIHYAINTPIFGGIDATNPAFNAGLGLDVAFAPSIGLRVLAKDYVGEFDFADATGFDIDGGISHNVALTIGLRIGF